MALLCSISLAKIPTNLCYTSPCCPPIRGIIFKSSMHTEEYYIDIPYVFMFEKMRLTKLLL